MSTIHGTNNADSIYDYDSQANDIDARGGNDLIFAAAEQAFETINGGEGFDTISYINLHGVHVNIGNVTQGYGYCDETWDLLTSIENVIGSNGNDVLTGNTGANELFGLAGNDLFEGKGGADRFDGGTGNDTVSYGHAATGVQIYLDQGKATGGEAQGDRFFSIENVVGSAQNDVLRGNAAKNGLTGGGGQDALFGFDGNDRLDGGGGNDLIVGGRGADYQTGGGGADTFRFLDTADSYNAIIGHRDTISDFNGSSGDRLDFAQIDAKASVSGSQDFHYIGANAFSAEGQIRAYASNGDMIVEVNTKGSGHAEMSILLDDIAGLVSSDFIL